MAYNSTNPWRNPIDTVLRGLEQEAPYRKDVTTIRPNLPKKYGIPPEMFKKLGGGDSRLKAIVKYDLPMRVDSVRIGNIFEILKKANTGKSNVVALVMMVEGEFVAGVIPSSNPYSVLTTFELHLSYSNRMSEMLTKEGIERFLHKAYEERKNVRLTVISYDPRQAVRLMVGRYVAGRRQIHFTRPQLQAMEKKAAKQRELDAARAGGGITAEDALKTCRPQFKALMKQLTKAQQSKRYLPAHHRRWYTYRNDGTAGSPFYRLAGASSANLKDAFAAIGQENALAIKDVIDRLIPIRIGSRDVGLTDAQKLKVQQAIGQATATPLDPAKVVDLRWVVSQLDPKIRDMLTKAVKKLKMEEGDEAVILKELIMDRYLSCPPHHLQDIIRDRRPGQSQKPGQALIDLIQAVTPYRPKGNEVRYNLTAAQKPKALANIKMVMGWLSEGYIGVAQAAIVESVPDPQLVLNDRQRQWPLDSKAVITALILPQCFLRLTTTNQAEYDEVIARALALEKYNAHSLAGESVVHPFLSIDEQTGRVRGHEGRHRAAAIINAGGGMMPVAIVLRPASRGHKMEHIPPVWRGEFDQFYTLNFMKMIERGWLRIVDDNVQRQYQKGDYIF